MERLLLEILGDAVAPSNLLWAVFGFWVIWAYGQRKAMSCLRGVFRRERWKDLSNEDRAGCYLVVGILFTALGTTIDRFYWFFFRVAEAMGLEFAERVILYRWTVILFALLSVIGYACHLHAYYAAYGEERWWRVGLLVAFTVWTVAYMGVLAARSFLFVTIS